MSCEAVTRCSLGATVFKRQPPILMGSVRQRLGASNPRLCAVSAAAASAAAGRAHSQFFVCSSSEHPAHERPVGPAVCAVSGEPEPGQQPRVVLPTSICSFRRCWPVAVCVSRAAAPGAVHLPPCSHSLILLWSFYIENRAAFLFSHAKG